MLQVLMFVNPLQALNPLRKIARIIKVILAVVLFITLIKKNRTVPVALGVSIIFYFVLGILL